MSRRHKDKAKASHVASLMAGPAGPLVRVDLPPMDLLHRAGLPSSIVEGWRTNHLAVWIGPEPSTWGDVVHMWVRRHDGSPIRSWALMQELKNELVGEDRVAVEVYPAAADVVDDANMYHLWVLPKGFALPFGLGGRR